MASSAKSRSRRPITSSNTASSGVKKTVSASSKVNAEAVKKYVKSKSNVDSGFPLLKLPAELRYQILTEALATDFPLRLLWNDPSRLMWPASKNIRIKRLRHDPSYGLLCANKQLQEECREILFANTPFILYVGRLRRANGTNVGSALVNAVTTSLRGFRTIILVMDSYDHYELSEILEFVSGVLEPKKKVVIRFVGYKCCCTWELPYLLDVLNKWLPKSESIRLDCPTADLDCVLAIGPLTSDAQPWGDFFRRFRDRIDMEVEEESSDGIVST